MNRNITSAFKSGLDKAYSQLGDGAGHPEVMLNAATLKSSLKEEDSDIKYVKPNFEREFDEAKRYREFKGMSKKEWIEIAKNGSVTSFERIEKNLGNIDLDFEKLDKDKRGRFQAAFKNKKIEVPIVVKLKNNHYDLLGGNTRLAGLLKHGIKPKMWIIDVTKMSKGETNEEKLKGGKSDDKTIKDLAQKHAYDDSTDSTSKEKIKTMYNVLKLQLEKGVKVEMEHTKDRQKAKEIAMDHLSEDPKYYTKLSKIEAKEQDKLSAKKQFSQDLQQDPDFIEFKKRAKYKQGYKDFNFGVPNVTSDDPYISKKKYKHVGKGEYTETTGASSAGSYVGPFAMDSKFVQKSNAETPKSELDEVQYDDYDLQPVKVATNSDGSTFRIGDRAIAFDRFKPIRIISLQKDNRGRVMAYHREGDFMASVNIDGLIPLGKEVSKIEANEVTGASSAGQYSGPAMWAKSTSKKDWRGASKPLYKGGKFVQVKGKCKKFPYCNQGDIKALKIWENENMKTAIQRVSENTGLSDITIKGILQYEMNNIPSKKV